MSDPEIAYAYRNAPAAKTLHHAFIGGLLDHVVSLFKACDLVSRNYPQIDRDLLLTGAFLHDIGKVHELSYARSFSYTTRGQLLGHMIIELEMLRDKLPPGFPPELKTLIEHMIISHHGQYEFGSPKLPMFPEALLLHYMDDLDSKMESMRAHFEREAAVDSPWTSYNPSLGRPLLDPVKFLRPPKPAEPEQEEVEPQSIEVSVEPVPDAAVAVAAAAAGESVSAPPYLANTGRDKGGPTEISRARDEVGMPEATSSRHNGSLPHTTTTPPAQVSAAPALATQIELLQNKFKPAGNNNRKDGK